MEKLDTEITDLKDKCPAFMDKCPFDKPELKSLVEEAKKCPAFKEECMFKNAATLQDVYKQLSDIPDMKEGQFSILFLPNYFLKICYTSEPGNTQRD